MNGSLLRTRCLPAVALALVTSLSAPSVAAPGAHGPGGEHLDAPAAANGSAASPRLEARSELFELVARLEGGELSILIDRYESNEPVLGANVAVASGALEASAKFHADLGDYAVDDPALLQALGSPGEHALVFTIVAGKESDLLEGVLSNGAAQAAPDAAHDHCHAAERAAWAGAGLLGFAAIAFIAWRRRRSARPSIELGGKR